MTFSKLISVGALTLTVSFGAACTANSADVKTAQASNYLKPGASVTYSHNLKSQLSAGETTTFNLSLGESYTGGDLKVSLTTVGDIGLISTSSQAEFDMAAATSHDMSVSLTANNNGRHYINVQALATDSRGNTQPRIFSIPVQVGPVIPQKPDDKMKTLEDGTNIIEMEAQEVIK